jgi:hypothetical protein
MAPKRTKASKQPRGAQKWVLAELRALNPGARLSTSQIAKRIGKARQKTFHKNSVYNALRLLVGRGAIDVVRSGRQKTYSAAASGSSAPSPSSAGGRVAAPIAESPELGPVLSHFPHKLALGEILVLSIGSGEVLTATNLHGRLVLERHPVPG